MIVIDRLIGNSLSFVLDKIARAVDGERNDVGRLREQLLDAQVRFEAGEIGADELDALEAETFARLRPQHEGEGRGPIEVATVEIPAAMGEVGDPAPRPRRRRRPKIRGGQ